MEKKTTEYYRSPIKYPGLRAAFALLLSLASLWGARHYYQDPDWVAVYYFLLISIVFLSAALYIASADSSHTEHWLILNDDEFQIRFPLGRFMTIPWSAVKNVFVTKPDHSPAGILNVELYDASIAFGQMPILNRIIALWLSYMNDFAPVLIDPRFYQGVDIQELQCEFERRMSFHAKLDAASQGTVVPTHGRESS
jgi:hypothetical protein